MAAGAEAGEQGYDEEDCLDRGRKGQGGTEMARGAGKGDGSKRNNAYTLDIEEV